MNSLSLSPTLLLLSLSLSLSTNTLQVLEERRGEKKRIFHSFPSFCLFLR